MGMIAEPAHRQYRYAIIEQYLELSRTLSTTLVKHYTLRLCITIKASQFQCYIKTASNHKRYDAFEP